MKNKSIKDIMLQTISIMLLTACGVSTPQAKNAVVDPLIGNWLVEKVYDEPRLINSKVELTLNSDNGLSGIASCNNITSTYTTKNNALTIGPTATTRKMCLPALMAQESKLLQALTKVKRFQVNNGFLVMFDQKGTQLLTAKRNTQ